MKRYLNSTAATLFAAVGLLFAVCSNSAQAQYPGLISSVDAKRVGLEVMWSTGIELDPSSARVAGGFLFVSSRDATTTFEMTYSGKRTIVSEFDYGPNGKIFGVEGAEEWIKVSAEILKQSRDIDAKIEKFVTPKTMLYISTTDGLVQSIDAATGKTAWTVRPGKRGRTTLTPCANDDYVCVVTGASIYCLDATDGRMLWNEKLRNAPGAAPAMSNDFVFVPLVNGFVEAFPLFERTTKESEKEKAERLTLEKLKTEDRIEYEAAVRHLRKKRYGRISNTIPKHYSLEYFVSPAPVMATPTVTELTTSWPTTGGQFDIGKNSRDDIGKMEFRIETGAPIVASAAANNKVLYFAGLSGSVYAVDETSGKINWSFDFGEAFSQSPIVLGDSVFVISDDFNLFKINKRTGVQDKKWPNRIPNMKSFVTGSKDRLYCIDKIGNLVAIRRDTGAREASIALFQQDLHILNHKSDRMYVGTRLGAVECLREIGSIHPYFHGEETEVEEPKVDTPPTDGTEKPAEEEEVNPFKKGVNPFGKPAEKGPNPFGSKKDDSKKDDK